MKIPTAEEVKELGKLALWEYGRKRLGYGNWDEDSEIPFQKYAGLESHKLWLTMNKRNISNSEFVLCVDYCATHHIRVEVAMWVFQHIKEAKIEERERQAVPTDLAQQINEAVAYERALASPDMDWVEKLLRSRGEYRMEVLDEWRKHLHTATSQAR